jgi:hypothetical protein
MASAATVFRLTWRVGRAVRVNSNGRKGSIRAVIGTGSRAVIVVAVTGGTPTSFRPSQLTPL